MIKIGITGQSGFIGTHLYNFFGLMKEEIERVDFKDEMFSDRKELENFVSECDVVIHLAALNRHNDPGQIYNTNLDLVNRLIASLEASGSRPHILFASSVQEDRDNIFGRSKRAGRELLAQWAEKEGASFSGLIIPNVFGPFGHPYYNSVVATFAHQLTHDEEPEIKVDAKLELICINDLVKQIYGIIRNNITDPGLRIQHTAEASVSEILELLRGFKDLYFNRGIIPDLRDEFQRNMFNTFVCYIDLEKHFPVHLTKSTDDRGSFVETVKLHSGGQVSFSTTLPGITRGNHFHTRKAERFAVIKGRARIQLRRIGTGKVFNFELDGNEPAFVDMPVWYTHNITNTGNDELYTLFWINEFFNPGDPDTFYEKV
ncbi:MAG TPA: SDR family oxidoreductase [Bacteroidetes bacterium]|nr:SDR family oxidoreductase [Bacteroidota bacterium]